MKKKMLFMAALAGVVTLASCVKDDESGSVTAVRNAKAAQLNADATLKQAQAANEQAQAAYNQADAAFRAAQARQEAVQASIDEASQASDIARIIAQNNNMTATANQNWQNAINQLKQFERQELDQLIQRYQTAVWDYQNAIDDVLNVQANIKSAQLDKENAVKSLENLNKNDKQNLAEKQAELAALKEMETTGMTQAEKDAALAVKWQEFLNAQSEFDQSAEVAAYVAAAAALKDAKDVYDEAEQAILDVDALQNVFDWGGNENTVADPNPFEYFISYTYNTGAYSIDWYGWVLSYAKYRVNETNKLNADRTLANAVTIAKDALDDATDLLGTTADTKDTKTKREANKDGGGNQLPTLYADLATAKAMPETTDAEKAAKKAAIENAEDAIASQLDNINNGFWGFQHDYDDAVANQKEFNDAFAALDLDAYAKICEAYKKACEDFNEAAQAVSDKEDDVNAIFNEYNALNNISVQDIDGQIKQVEKDIADLEDAIANRERLIDPANAPLTYDEVIAELELDLAKKQAEVEVQAAKLAIAKEELEEAIGDFDPEEIDDEPAADADADTEG